MGGREGTFVIRDSSSEPGNLVITARGLGLMNRF